jgi:hypothetical protein
MQIADIKATQAQFEASLGIDTFDQLCTVLSYLSENKELNKQLCNAYHDVMPNCVFNKQFNHVFLNSEQAFGKYYSKYDIDLLMALMRSYIAPHRQVGGFDDFSINFSAIKLLAGMGVNVAVNFEGDADTDKESETLTSVSVTFAVVQYPIPFKITC